MAKKKTHEQYLAEVATKNPNVEVVGTYIGNKEKILHRCKIDGYEWLVRPDGILHGLGCPKCKGGIKKTHDEYICEVALLNSDIEVIGRYVNAKTKIQHKCKIHSVEWSSTPDNILQGKGCPICATERKAVSNRLSNDEYAKKLSIANKNIEVIDEYIDAKTKITHHCLLHDVYWKTTPDSVLSKGSGCPECAKKIRYVARAKTHQQYVKEVEEKNPNIEVIGEYVNYKRPIEHRCKKHNYIYLVNPDSILSGYGCIYCRSDKLRERSLKSEEQYILELSEEKPYIILIGKYTYSLEPTLHKCLKCDYEWYPTPSRLLNTNCGCPNCYKSSGEQKVESWLDNNNIEYVFQKRFDDCRDTHCLPFDFYLPSYNVAIEYDGQQHFYPVTFGGMSLEKAQQCFERTVYHDGIKNKYCEDNNIQLLRIPYYENVEQQLNNFLFI